MTEREQLEQTQKVLQEGIRLTEMAIAHVSHGGPKREQAEKWVEEAKEVLRPKATQ